MCSTCFHSHTPAKWRNTRLGQTLHIFQVFYLHLPGMSGNIPTYWHALLPLFYVWLREPYCDVRAATVQGECMNHRTHVSNNNVCFYKNFT